MSFFQILITVFIVVLVLGVYMGVSGANSFKKKYGIAIADLTYAGKYIAGIPDLEKPIKKVYFNFKNNEIEIFEIPDNPSQAKKYKFLKYADIKKVNIEDQSLISKRVGVKRMLAVGLFAFALKKKTKDEILYITFDYSINNIDFTAIFEYEGKGSSELAHTALSRIKSKLI